MKAIDLFAGCGGLTLGLQRAGIQVACAVDNWQSARNIYSQNFNHPILDLDLLDVDNSVERLAEFEADLIVGGPPCQDFSHAGKRDENGGRANLTVSFATIVARLRPEFFMMENVDQVVRFQAYDKALKILRGAGYKTYSNTLNASYFGVPQRRKRHFVIGHLSAKSAEFLDPYIRKRQNRTETTLRDKFGHLFNFDNYYRHPRNYGRRGVFSLDEPSPTIRGVNRPIPANYKGHPIDTEKDLKKVRPLTTMERALIQGFDSDFKFVGSKTDIEQAVGNAVPVGLADVVGSALVEYERDFELGVVVTTPEPNHLSLFDPAQKVSSI